MTSRMSIFQLCMRILCVRASAHAPRHGDDWMSEESGEIQRVNGLVYLKRRMDCHGSAEVAG